MQMEENRENDTVTWTFDGKKEFAKHSSKGFVASRIGEISESM